jgi:hypothetical protein
MHRTTSYYGGEGEGTGLLCLSIALHVISSLHIILWRAPVGSRALTIRHNSPILSVEGCAFCVESRIVALPLIPQS